MVLVRRCQLDKGEVQPGGQFAVERRDHQGRNHELHGFMEEYCVDNTVGGVAEDQFLVSHLVSSLPDKTIMFCLDHTINYLVRNWVFNLDPLLP